MKIIIVCLNIIIKYKFIDELIKNLNKYRFNINYISNIHLEDQLF